MEGVEKSMKSFIELGYDPLQIAIVVIYDGIDKMNKEKDNDRNMVKFFTKLDYKYNLFGEIKNYERKDFDKWI